jgi:hypothetical protein
VRVTSAVTIFAALGNRRINHAIHMAAITQIRHRHSKGRAHYDKKVASDLFRCPGMHRRNGFTCVTDGSRDW